MIYIHFIIGLPLIDPEVAHYVLQVYDVLQLDQQYLYRFLNLHHY